MSFAKEIDLRIKTATESNDKDALDKLLNELYQTADEAEKPYDAAIELKPEYRAELDGDGFEGTAGLNWANRIARASRLVSYRLKTMPGFRGARIVSEGDSWFQYPVLLKDIIDNIMEHPDLAVMSLCGAGDLVEHMAVRREYHAALAETGARAMLLSGGGNDLLGEGRLFELLRPYKAGAGADDLIDRDRLQHASDEILGYYRRILGDVRLHHPSVVIFGHGYDTPFPRKGKSHFGKPFEKAGIPLDVGRDIIKVMVEHFREGLSALEDAYENYRFIDLTGTVGSHPGAWFDELHPRDPGFAKATKPLQDAVLAHLDGLSGPLFEGAVLSPSAAAVRIVLDPGHGGSQNLPGSSWNNAFGPSGSLEKTWTLDVAQRTKAVLAARGRGVQLTRDSDINLSRDARRDISRIIAPDVFVSIHFNASQDHSAQGTETYIHTTASSPRSVALMRRVQAAMVAATGHRDRNAHRTPDGILRGDFGVIREAEHAPNTAVCLLEVSFMDRLDEEQRIGQTAYRDKIATALADGIMAFLQGGTGLESAMLESGSRADGFEEPIQEDAARAGMSVIQYLGLAEAPPMPERMERDPVFMGQGVHVDGSLLLTEQDPGPRFEAEVLTPRASGNLSEILYADIVNRGPQVSATDDPDAGEDAFIDPSQGFDLSGFGQDPTRDMEMLERAFARPGGGFEADSFNAAGFADFATLLGLRHFRMAELLFLGGSNESGKCARRNSLPPAPLWGNIANTARMLDEIRERLGYSIRVLSVYRNRDYNDCVGGKGESLHKTFNAIDWAGSQGTAADWHRVAVEVRGSRPEFRGGIGRYSGFIHIDTRGQDRNW